MLRRDLGNLASYQFGLGLKPMVKIASLWSSGSLPNLASPGCDLFGGWGGPFGLDFLRFHKIRCSKLPRRALKEIRVSGPSSSREAESKPLFFGLDA
jgi:hypothetical protein